MITRIFVASALLILACEGRSARQTHPLEVRYEEWLRGKIEKMNNEVMVAHEDLKDKLNSFIALGKKEIDEIADSHVDLLNNSDVHEKCLAEGLLQLDEAKKVGQGSFFTCSNLTTAVEEVGALSWQVVYFVSKVLIYLDNILNGLSQCTWAYYMPPLKCYFSYAYTAISDMTGFIVDVKTLLKNIKSTAEDIEKQIAYCKNGPKNHVQQLAQNVMNEVLLCTQRLN